MVTPRVVGRGDPLSVFAAMVRRPSAARIVWAPQGRPKSFGGGPREARSQPDRRAPARGGEDLTMAAGACVPVHRSSAPDRRGAQRGARVAGPTGEPALQHRTTILQDDVARSRAMSPRRAVHLVGSVPLADAESVFRTVAAALGDLLRSIPDGETGPRSRWNSWTAPTYERTRGLELVPPPPGSYTPWHQARLVVDPAELVLERIGFADHALASYAVFARLAREGAIPPHVRFQVCLPSPVAPMIVLVEEGSRAAVEPAHLRQLHAEVAEIAGAIPHERLTIQWDVCQDVGIWE